jgi:hypothetical protein
MVSYATPDDLKTWLGLADPPANAAARLRSATFVVAVACNRNPYSPDAPTVADAAVLKDATCAQAASWVALNVDPAALGIGSAPVKKSSILGGDVERDTTGQAAALAAATRELAPEARAILLSAGLLWQPVPLGADPTDPLPQWGLGRRWWPFPEPMSGELEWPLRWP